MRLSHLHIVHKGGIADADSLALDCGGVPHREDKVLTSLQQQQSAGLLRAVHVW